MVFSAVGTEGEGEPNGLTHFRLRSYERALRLPESFPISDLTRLGVKSRLGRLSWRAFASTHPLMLPSTSPRYALLACPHFLFGICPRSRWSPPFLLHAPALIHPSLAEVQLSLTLTLSHLTIWCFRKTALLLFLLAKKALAYLPTSLSVALRPPFPFQQAHYAQVFPLKPAPFCKLFTCLGSTNKSATSLLSSYLTLVLSSPVSALLHLSFCLNFSVRSGRNCLLSPPVLPSYSGYPDTRFSRGTTRLMICLDGKH